MSSFYWGVPAGGDNIGDLAPAYLDLPHPWLVGLHRHHHGRVGDAEQLLQVVAFLKELPCKEKQSSGMGTPGASPAPAAGQEPSTTHFSLLEQKGDPRGSAKCSPKHLPTLDLMLPRAPTCRVPDLDLRGRAAQGDGDLLQAGVERDGPRVLPAVLVVRGQQVDFGGLDGLFHPLQYLGAGGGGLTWISPSPYGIAISGLFQKQGCIAGAQNLRHTPPDARGTEQFVVIAIARCLLLHPGEQTRPPVHPREQNHILLGSRLMQGSQSNLEVSWARGLTPGKYTNWVGAPMPQPPRPRSPPSPAACPGGRPARSWWPRRARTRGTRGGSCPRSPPSARTPPARVRVPCSVTPRGGTHPAPCSLSQLRLQPPRDAVSPC